MTPIRFLPLLALLTLAAPALADTNHVRMSAIPAQNQIEGGDMVSVMIRQEIDPDWHTYWINPGDSGMAPNIRWTMPDGFALEGDMLWPVPKRIAYAGLVNFGYEGTVTMIQDIAAPDILPDGPLNFTANVEILVCKDICIPEFKTLSFTLNDPAQPLIDRSDDLGPVWNDLPTAVNWPATYREEDGDLVIDITSTAPSLWNGAQLTSFAVFPVEWGITRNPAMLYITAFDGREITMRIARDTRPLSEVSDIDIVLGYDRPDGGTGGVALTLSPDPAQQSSSTPPAIQAGAEKKSPNGGNGSAANIEISLIQALLFALIGGVLLNLMPCVFPILSMKALSLVQLQGKDRAAAVGSGVAYTAGIMISFAAVGGALLALKGGGENLGWGFHLQNPVITLFLAYLLFVIGLNLSGLFELRGGFANIGAELSRKKGWQGSFFTGVLATLVATPCTAPFMAGALGFALVAPVAVAMAVFLMLGLGLALPYLAVSLSPALAAALPRPGPWMVRFREFLAFPMYGAAAWLVWVLAQQAGAGAIMWALAGMVAMAFAIWLLAHRPERGRARIALTVIAALALIFTAMPLLDSRILHMPALSEGRAGIVAEPFTQALYAEALDGDEPLFLYMTAAWCITCKANERVAIYTEDTAQLFARHGVRVISGDWTTMNPEITDFLRSHGRSGVPLYVYHASRDPGSGTRPDPVILPQILTPAIIAQTIEKQGETNK